MMQSGMHDNVASPGLADKNCLVDCQNIEQFTQVLAHGVKVVAIVRLIAAAVSSKVDSDTAMTPGGKGSTHTVPHAGIGGESMNE